MSQSVTVVGSVALDTVETPTGKNEEGLGGAATYFSLAAANYCPVRLVGVVGQDFPEEHVALLDSKGIDLEGLERSEGETFRWVGRYHENMNDRDTLETHLNVFEQFHPKLPEAAQSSKYLFLGNIHPSLQLEVLEQTQADFVALDTMDLWINIEQDALRDVLKRVNAIIINDSEVDLFTGQRNLVQGAKALHAMGPDIAVIKKGEHGCMLMIGDDIFAIPAFPLPSVVDPTGAGDSFAGGFMGYIAQQDKTDFHTLKNAVVHGSVVASHTCEQFGPDRLAQVSPESIDLRYKDFKFLVEF
jgi:sugar/nucleoside kinase (ribokinase family)